MTDIIISFDTEDYTNQEAADAIRDEANLLREEGITGCFNVVGLLAKQLVAWERRDVLEALSHHEIGLHTYGHSLHPPSTNIRILRILTRRTARCCDRRERRSHF